MMRLHSSAGVGAAMPSSKAAMRQGRVIMLCSCWSLRHTDGHTQCVCGPRVQPSWCVVLSCMLRVKAKAWDRPLCTHVLQGVESKQPGNNTYRFSVSAPPPPRPPLHY